MMAVRRVALAALCCCSFAVGAARRPPPPPEGPDDDVVATKRQAKAHTQPDANSPVQFVVAAGEHLAWVVQTKKDGFYRVIRRDRGPQGWVAEADLRIVHEHVAGQDENKKVCAASLDQCPARGCAEEGSAEARDNEVKRARPRPGAPLTLAFEDFAQLQREADERVGEGPDDLTPEQHEALEHLRVASGVVSEGDPVRVVGYISKSNEGLHVNKSGESVNCLLKKPADNDFHIPLVAHVDDTEYEGIVVEMIPQDRPAAWTLDALKEIQDKGDQVWVEGGLAYDKVHYVNTDRNNPFKDEPERMSLWEVHPITRFLVCRKPRCDPDNEHDWTALEQQP